MTERHLTATVLNAVLKDFALESALLQAFWCPENCCPCEAHPMDSDQDGRALRMPLGN